MITILFIVPYPEMKEKVEAVLAEFPPREDLQIRLETRMVDYSLDLDVSGCDAIIARGYTAESMEKKHPEIPVIRLTVSGFDVFRALRECRDRYRPEKIAVFGFRQQQFEIGMLSEELSVRTRVYEYIPHSELSGMLKKARRDGCTALVGGYSAFKEAEKADFPAVVFRTGENAVVNALGEAVRTVERLRAEHLSSEMYKTIIYSSTEGILYVDSEGVIRVRNHVARRMNGDQSLMNRRLKDAMPHLSDSVQKVLETGDPVSGQIYRLPASDLTVSVSIRPVISAERIAGVVVTLSDITEIQSLEEQIRRKLSGRGMKAKYRFQDIAHKSAAMDKVIRTAEQYAATDANVILVGETGTGKELFAQSIHQASSRKKGPFVVINCAALPETLLESELFGYAEGAFTGAAKGGKSGLFEQAHGGTLFLDEIEEIPPATQTKLLRVLQERQVRRIGDSRLIDVNVRILSATNQSIQGLCGSGRFRKDLMYRLDVLRLYIPPLRDRGEDKELLFGAFLSRACERTGRKVPKLSRDAVPLLRDYPFEGNIRELNNVIERICAACPGGVLTREDIEAALYPRDLDAEEAHGSGAEARKRKTGDRDREEILNALQACGGSRQAAAEMLQMNRTTLWRKMRKYGLS